MKFLVENITDKDGITKTNDRYPNRIGSITDINVFPRKGESLIFNYIKDDEFGNRIEDHITMTSPVTNIDVFRNESKIVKLVVYTLYSIYHFTRLED